MVKIYKIDLSNIIYVANFVQNFFSELPRKKNIKIIINFSVITRKVIFDEFLHDLPNKLIFE